MSKGQDLTRLKQISRLLLETNLARLNLAAQARQQSEAQLAGLEERPASEGALPEVAAQMAALNYQRWAETRRAEINLVLAKQTAEWIEARDAACLAFGRDHVLQALKTRQSR